MATKPKNIVFKLKSLKLKSNAFICLHDNYLQNNKIMAWENNN